MSAPTSTPIHATVAQGSTSSVSENSAKRTRSSVAHLKPLYDEWNRNPGQLPSLPVRKALKAEVEVDPVDSDVAIDFLTDVIQKLSGARYDIGNLNSFFNGRISRLRDQSRDARFPTLTKPAIENLEQLLKTSNNPTPELIALFAPLIVKAYPGCTHKDVAAYIGHAQADQQRFPTPTSISSPGSGPSSPLIKFQPPIPSTFPPETGRSNPLGPPPEHRQFISPPPYIIRKYTPSPPPTANTKGNTSGTASNFNAPQIKPPIKAECYSFPPNPLQSENLMAGTTTRSSLTMIEMLADGIQEGLDTPTATTFPSSAAELDAMFSRIEKLSHSLSRAPRS